MRVTWGVTGRRQQLTWAYAYGRRQESDEEVDDSAAISIPDRQATGGKCYLGIEASPRDRKHLAEIGHGLLCSLCVVFAGLPTQEIRATGTAG